MSAPLPTRSKTPAVCDCGLGHEHGTAAMYDRHRCGCFKCRLNSAARRRACRAGASLGGDRWIDGTGTRRRLQALAVLGVPLPVIAERLGVTFQAVEHLRAERSAGRRVRVDVAARVQKVYDELWDAPAHLLSARTRTFALRRGWAPPLAWDDDSIDDPTAQPSTGQTFRLYIYRNRLHVTATVDEIAVERIMTGTLRVPRNAQSPERIEAIRRLATLGHPDRLIGQRVGMTQAAVTQTRLRHGIPPGEPLSRPPRGEDAAA